jgi:hypothetical protein
MSILRFKLLMAISRYEDPNPFPGVRMGDLRRTRYIGLPKTRLLHLLMATALNLLRMAAWLGETSLAQTRTSPFAALGKAAACF